MITSDSNDSRPITPDEVNRLWQHGLHEERLFHDRLNYFSLVEMGLLTIFGIMFNKEPALGFFLPLTIIALLFTLLWLTIQARHWSYCAHIAARQKRLIPEYRATISEFSEKSWSRSFSISKTLALLLPALFACTWIAFFVWLLVRPAAVAPQSEIISFERLMLIVVSAALVWVIVKLRRLEKHLRELNSEARK
jgi:hypothetical protein